MIKAKSIIVCSFISVLLILGLFQVLGVSPKLQAFYNFEKANTTTVFDKTGNWHGQLNNGASVISLGHNSFLNLDGQDDFMSISPGVLNNLSEGTVEANIYLKSIDPIGGANIIAKGDNSLTNFIIGVISDGRLVAHMGTSLYLASQNTVPLNDWTKIALSWDGTEWKMYLNDHLEAQANTTVVPLYNSVNVVKIGKHDHIQGPFYFNGSIDNLRISKIAY